MRINISKLTLGIILPIIVAIFAIIIYKIHSDNSIDTQINKGKISGIQQIDSRQDEAEIADTDISNDLSNYLKIATDTDISTKCLNNIKDCYYEDLVTIYKQKYECDWEIEKGNMQMMECYVGKLDRAAAERQWKQNKILGATQKQFSHPDEYPVNFVDFQKQMKSYMKNYDEMRFLGCSRGFYQLLPTGSGTAGYMAECQLEKEIEELADMDYLYLHLIDRFAKYSGDKERYVIKGYEPSEKDIENIVTSNNTIGGCVRGYADSCEPYSFLEIR